MDLGKLLGPSFNATAMLTPGVSLFEIIARTLVVYVVLVVGIRLFSKRAFGPLTPFDFVLVLVLSNAVQNAMTGGDNSLTGGVTAALVLFGVNALLNSTLYKLHWFRQWLVGHDIVLIHNGQINTDNLRRTGLDMDELRRSAQEKNFYTLDDVGEAIFEANGDIAFFPATMKAAVSRRSDRQAPVSETEAK